MLGDDLLAVLPELQAHAESTRTDRCTITRASTEGTFDPETGTTEYPATTLYEDQPCRVRVPALTDRRDFSGQHEFTFQDAILSLAPTVTGLDTDDTVTITSSLDPDLIGREYTLMAVHRASQITARRCVIREVTA